MNLNELPVEVVNFTWFIIILQCKLSNLDFSARHQCIQFNKSVCGTNNGNNNSIIQNNNKKMILVRFET